MIFKNQITIINISVTVVSAGAIVFLAFSTIRNMVNKTLKLVEPQISRNFHFLHPSSSSQSSKAVRTSSANLPLRIQIPRFPQAENSVKKIPTINKEERAPEVAKLPQKTEQAAPKSDGCPKNLPYFAMRPRPKQTPEECFSCKNLITCVCLTSE